MLKIGGVYVSPFEIEATMVEHPAVLESAVIGLPDADGLMKTKAFVVLKPGTLVTADELKAFIKSRLAPYKYPRAIEFVAELPKTATGKDSALQTARERERESSTVEVTHSLDLGILPGQLGPIQRPGLAEDWQAHVKDPVQPILEVGPER